MGYGCNTLDDYVRGIWITLNIRGYEVAAGAALGILVANNCLLHVMFEVTRAEGRQLVDARASWWLAVGDQEEEMEMLHSDGARFDTWIENTKVTECGSLLLAARRERRQLFNEGIRDDANLVATVDLPYSFDKLKQYAHDVNDIDKLIHQAKTNSRRRGHDFSVKATFELMARINAFKLIDVSFLARLKSIGGEAYKILTADSFRQYVEDKCDKGLLPQDKCDACAPLVVPTANLVATRDDMLSSTLKIAGVCSKIINHDKVEELARLSKESTDVGKCSGGMADALGRLYRAAANIEKNVNLLHTKARCLWELASSPRMWVLKQQTKNSQHTEVNTAAIYWLRHETANVYVGGCEISQDQVAETAKCASQLTEAWRQLTTKDGKQEEVEWMKSSLCPDVDEGIYGETRRLLAEGFNTHMVESADECSNEMTAAIQALTKDASVVGGEASIVETRVNELHKAAGCLWKQNETGRSLVNNKLGKLVVPAPPAPAPPAPALPAPALPAHASPTAALPPPPPRKGSANDAIRCMWWQTADLYIGGCKLSREEWEETVNCASQLTAAWKQLGLITWKNLEDSKKEEVEWMESPCRRDVGGGIYETASSQLIQQFRQRVVIAAVAMAGLKGESYIKTASKDLLRSVTSDIVTTSIASLDAVAEHADDDASKATWKTLKSIVTIWAKCGKKLVHKVQLIGWILLATTTVKRNETITEFVDKVLECHGTKGGKAYSAVNQYVSLNEALLFVQKKWEEIRIAQDCYGEMARYHGNVPDQDYLVADVLEKWLLDGDRDLTNIDLWAQAAQSEFGKQLRKQVLTNIKNVRHMTDKQNKQYLIILKNDENMVTEAGRKMVTQLWESL
eukprot:GHVS01001518.1.p1 GENE.GHVS01001518.1~~GHVS01001518.1.p1  ORF type:complete len:856 (+),score=140.76 GHVS01001518.1:424-2991(+)